MRMLTSWPTVRTEYLACAFLCAVAFLTAVVLSMRDRLTHAKYSSGTILVVRLLYLPHGADIDRAGGSKALVAR